MVKMYKTVDGVVVRGSGLTKDAAFKDFELNCIFSGLRNYIIKSDKFYNQKRSPFITYVAEVRAITIGTSR